ncbi:DUF354 domain-containing protein [candidate division KSB3 bacterium]|uniref:DUF354 domain-containing protein n=1 Tax=candidate division KSB3 bacterium TaxID=2044937 RepID=A0A9D5JS27_9BACT|nr:DUF354 domain-containing protein [candidate division KSB3 bacterium]
MKILVDINHPAHVHLFKHLIWEARAKGHTVIVTASRKDVSFDLLKAYQIDFIDVGSYGNTVYSKLVQIPVMAFKLCMIIRRYQPDIAIGLASSRITHGALLSKTKTLVCTDTEHASEEIMLFKPFATKILTPNCFTKNLGPKQIRFNGYKELAYLHPRYFHPDPSILKMLGVRSDEKYVIMRFVSWQAAHDFAHKGLSLENKVAAVREFSQYAKVFISSEKHLPSELQEFQIALPVDKIHDAMYYATLLYGESATMASEGAVLGTPAIFLDYAGRGYTTEQEKIYGSVFNFMVSRQDQEHSIKKGIELLQLPNVKQQWAAKRQQILQDKTDVTQWMLNFIENDQHEE